MLLRDPETQIIGQHSLYDPNYLDFGDASRSTGIMATFGSKLDQEIILKHLTSKGFVRHPNQQPWNDPKNFSRDQLICLASGLYRSNQSKVVRSEFYRRRYWFGLCPNGDFLGPEFYLHLILCGKIFELYWLFPILIWFQILHILWATKINPEHEQNQTICLADRSGLLFLWAKLHINWKASVMYYWARWRDQKEISEYLIEQIELKVQKQLE